MCPMCIANAAWVASVMAASVTSTGGLTLFAATKLFRAKEGREDLNEPNSRSIDHDQD